MDKILLLGAGKAMYNGSPAEVGQFLDSKGFPCPVVDTVADHMLEVVSHKENHATLTGLCGSSSPTKPKLLDAETEDDFDSDDTVERGSLFNELIVLFGRASKDIFRNRELFVMQMFLSILLAVFVGAIFNDVTNNLAGFQNRMGVSLRDGERSLLFYCAAASLHWCPFDRHSTFPCPSSRLRPLVPWISLLRKDTFLSESRAPSTTEL